MTEAISLVVDAVEKTESETGKTPIGGDAEGLQNVTSYIAGSLCV